MKKARTALAIYGALGIAAVAAQDVFVGNAFFHTWQYACILALCAIAVLRVVRSAGAAFAGIGACVVIAGGLAAGLLGADTQTLVRSPGTVVPIPDVGGAAFFPVVDAAHIVQAAPLLLRRRGQPELTIEPGRVRYLGASILRALPRTAAFIEARDRNGNHLTLTQPANSAFLSPVMLFPRMESIEGKMLRADSFAVPAVHRVVRVLYFSPQQTADFKNAATVSGKEALLFAMSDEGGGVVPAQMALTTSGRQARLEGLTIRATIGSYSALEVASAVHPLPAVLGTLVFCAGFFIPRFSSTALARPTAKGVFDT